MEINNQILESTGLSIVHSLWQGALLLFIVLSALVIARNKSARFRYLITLTGTFLLPAILIGNLIYFWPHQIVDNSMVASATETEMMANIPTQFSIPNNGQQQNNTVLWLNENASTIAIFWIVGMSLFLLKVLGSFVWLKRLTKQALPMHNTAVNELLTTIQEKLAIRRTVELKLSSWIKSPIILGVIRPTILFPIGLIEGLTTEEVEAILYHELAHLKRNDFVVNIMINVLQIVFFYHPAYWWMKSQLDNDLEFSTDELAIRHSKKKLPMIKALAKVQAYSLNQHSLAFAGNSKNQVLKRINLIMKAKQQPNWLSAVFTMVILLAAFGLISMQEKKTENGKAENQEEIMVDLNPKNDSISQIKFPLFQKNEKDSLVYQGYKYISFPLVPQKQDTIKVSEAIVDLIQNRSSFEVEYDLKGQIKSISKDGKFFVGEAFNLYKSAWNQIEALNSQVKAKAEAEQLRLLRLREQELQDRLESIDQQKKRMQEVDSALLEREHKIKEQHHLERLQQIARREWEYEKLKIRLEQVAYPGNKLDESEAQLIKELQARMRTLEDQMLEFNGIKLKSPLAEKEALERRLKDIEKKLNKEQNFEGVPFPNDPDGKKEFARIFLLDKLYPNSIIELDGKMRYDLKVSDLTEEDISKIDRVVFVKGYKMEKYAPKRKLKDIDWIIRIINEN